MDAVQPQGQYLPRLEQVADVGPGVVAAGIAVAVRVQGREVLGVLRVAHHQAAVVGKHGAVAGHAGGQHAVEHVHAPQHALDQAVRGAHAHQVAGLALGHVGHHLLQHVVHDLLGLAHGQAADAEARQVQPGHLPGALDAQVAVERPLHDAEQCLVLPGPGLHAALQPAQRAVHGVLGPGIVAGIGRALVKLHHDVRAQRLLDGDGFLGAYEHL